MLIFLCSFFLSGRRFVPQINITKSPPLRWCWRKEVDVLNRTPVTLRIFTCHIKSELVTFVNFKVSHRLHHPSSSLGVWRKAAATTTQRQRLQHFGSILFLPVLSFFLRPAKLISMLQEFYTSIDFPSNLICFYFLLSISEVDASYLHLLVYPSLTARPCHFNAFGWSDRLKMINRLDSLKFYHSIPQFSLYFVSLFFFLSTVVLFWLILRVKCSFAFFL